MTPPPWSKNVAVLVARIFLGIVFMAHGSQKLFVSGLSGTGDGFAALGVPAPHASAVVAALVEFVGGAALILGVGTVVAGVLLFLTMLGAYLSAHTGNGVFIDEGGFELVAALGAGALVLAAAGPGALSIDHLVRGRRQRATA